MVNKHQALRLVIYRTNRLDAELDAATTYYWRVKTSDGTNASYSIVYSPKTQ